MSLNLFRKDDLDEVVFENRNKQYGAYVLRKSYDSNLLKASASSFGFIFLVVGSVYVTSLLHDEIKPIVTAIQLPAVANKLTDIEIILDPPSVSTTPVVRNPTSEIFKIVKDPLVTQPPVLPVQPAQPSTGSVTGEGSSHTGETGTVGTIPSVAPPPEPAFVTFAANMPSFPGGQEAMMEYLSKNINYPVQAREIGKEGKVVVSFVVMTDGSIGLLHIEKGIGFGCDDEALRVVSSMPKWEAGKQNGKAVAVKLVLPIMFQLQ